MDKLTWKIDKLRNWDKNPRSISDKGFERLKKQIQTLGMYKPLLVTEDGTVLGGNMRLRAYRELGIKDVWVSVVDAPTEEKKLEYALSDNDRAGFYDDDLLANLTAELPDFNWGDYDVILNLKKMDHKFNYKWNLSDGYPEKNGLKVFSTFACGGGSTMGYKLAGYEVIGANDIDPQMARVYKQNHHPKYFFECPIKELINLELPEEFYNLDILDGSPPCSTFSMAGSREKAWGKEKMFREGQAKQVLDDLFFDFIDLIARLKPKVVVAENVKGMLAGNAKGYLLEIKDKLQKLGYDVQIFLLNGATMGLPQKRERVFVICNRMNFPKLKLEFNEKPILFKEIDDGILRNYEKILPCDLKYYDVCKKGDSIASVHPKGNRFNSIKLSENSVVNTIASGSCLYHPYQKRNLTTNELSKIGSFPLDYDFLNIKPKYLIGMSVPPIMMAQVSNQIYEQWFK